MCVDYTDLNKHCPKDPFGLPRIDEVVDSTAGCELLSFLDCYSGYHQISLNDMGRLSCCFSVPRDARILENFIFEKSLKILHDEFLYDESLNSYHSHIYMLARF